MGKEQALKPDIIVKNYWRNKEQFADFFNAVLFDGKQVINRKNWGFGYGRILRFGA